MKTGKMVLLMVVALCLPAAFFAVADEGEGSESLLETRTQKLSYSVGMQIGESLRANAFDLDLDALIRGLKDAYLGRETLMSEEELMQVQREFIAEQEQARQEKTGENLRKSREFLSENREREGVTVTASGLQYEVMEAGEGRRPGAEDTVEIHYVGRTIDDKVFDSSRQRGTPAVFPLNRIVPGLSEGIQLMRVGGSYRFYLPPELAYGESGAGANIEPNAALIFDVELLEIVEGN